MNFSFSYSVLTFSLILLLCFNNKPLINAETDVFNQPKSNLAQSIPDFNFVVAGDYGCGDNARRTINNMITRKPNLVLSTGDNSYSRTADCWFDVVSPLDKSGKVKVAFGDHDIDSNLTRYDQYLQHFNLSEPYYSFDYQNAHFLVMATGKSMIIPFNQTSSQYEFVKDDLAKARSNGSINWIIVVSYRPLYTSPTNHPVLDSLQDTYHPLFDKYGVDLVLQGHNHNYQRTYPLTYNASDPSNPIVTDKHTRDYKDIKGQVYVTVGTGGKDLYNFTGQRPYVIEQFERRGFINVDITDNGKNLTSTFFENRDMKDKDHFSIIENH